MDANDIEATATLQHCCLTMLGCLLEQVQGMLHTELDSQVLGNCLAVMIEQQGSVRVWQILNQYLSSSKGPRQQQRLGLPRQQEKKGKEGSCV
eukprot:1138991-Pelagomonas_calceolata.AAC.2